MELNLTIEHFMAFSLMAYAASFCCAGERLLRFIGWIGLWQLLTPVRPAWQDVPMMLVAWATVEALYFLALHDGGDV
jgi:hypothetical protein